MVKKMSNNIQYIKEYNKKTYKRLQTYLTKEKMEEFEKALKRNNLTKAQFINKAINQLINDQFLIK